MTEEIVHLLKARPTGSGRWFAKCPVHSEKSGSLSIRAGKKATLLHCFGCHAKSAQIMGALGYAAQDVFYDAGTKMDPEQRRKYKSRKQQEELIARLKMRWARSLGAIVAYPSERRYRRLVEQTAWRELHHQTVRLEFEF